MSGDAGKVSGDQPTSYERRRLLLALGTGAVNIAALHRLEVDGGQTESVGGGQGVGGGGPSGAAAAVGPAGPTMASGPDGRPELVELPTPIDGADGQTPGPGHLFDVAINGGRVIDPDTGFDGLANIGIDNDRITVVAVEPLAGREAINATGQVVAPGFVDLLSYEPNSFGVWLKLADGVTTNLAMHGVNNYADAFFRRYEEQTPIHYGGAFHHHFMRGFDIGAGIGKALGSGEQRRLDDLVASSLDQGFAGVSFSPEYSPGTTTDEMARLAALAADRGHPCFFHARHSDPDPPGTSLEAIDEILRIGAETGAAVHIEHLTSTGGTHVMAEAVGRIEAARSTGQDVTACVYPYDFWGTFLASARFSSGWRQRYRLDETDLQIAGTSTRLTAETFGQARSDNKLVAALGSIPESEIELALAQPWVVVASDAIPTVGRNNHPRGAGTFARTIARYVRDRGVLDLRSAVAKVTIGPARRVEGVIPAMKRKGRLRPGADADIVVFDPARIADRATVENPAEPSVGIDWVLVDGQVALRDGKVDRTVLAGRPLRSTPG